ncbi:MULTISPECIES: hypothetical protein [Komagataeibacter]|nr:MULTISPECIES: hypothetical protein [Komagataeibacter]EGG78739.1 hypothetical protein SXCC_00721 [Gluconacetobacter sp. SXCC-1]WNM07493.1 hypothetical protein RI056_10170 [Komagataeibacter nataicola]
MPVQIGNPGDEIFQFEQCGANWRNDNSNIFLMNIHHLIILTFG